MQIDDIDRRILAIVARDGRVSLKRLAAVVGLSRSAVTARLKRLEDGAIIRGYHASIAPADAPSVTRAVLLLRVARTPAYDIVDRLGRLDGVVQCRSVAGDIDLIVDVETRDVETLNRLRDAVASMPGISDCRTHLVLADNFSHRPAPL